MYTLKFRRLKNPLKCEIFSKFTQFCFPFLSLSGTQNASCVSPATLTSARAASTTETLKPFAPRVSWRDSPRSAWAAKARSKKITSPHWTANGMRAASCVRRAGSHSREETSSNTKGDPIVRMTTMPSEGHSVRGVTNPFLVGASRPCLRSFIQNIFSVRFVSNS